MLIQCTKKLLDELEIKPVEELQKLPLFSRHANLLTVNRRKTVVLVNDSNRYVVLRGFKAKDFKNFSAVIINSIRETFLDESIKAEIVEQFIKYSPEIIFTKTRDRSLGAKMNKACDIIARFENILDNNTLIQSGVSRKANGYSFIYENNNSIHPNERLYKDVEAFAKTPIF